MNDPLAELLGQVLALEYALRGVLLDNPNALREASLQVEHLRATAINSPTPDAAIVGIDKTARILFRLRVMTAQMLPRV